MPYIRKFLLAAALCCAALPAAADEYSAGDPCSSAGAYHVKNDAEGVYHLVCDGTVWKLLTFMDKNGEVGIGTATPLGKLSVENTGSGQSFVVADQANDTSPFVIDASGNVGVGISTPQAQLHIFSVAGATTIIGGNNNGDPSSLWLASTSSTLGSAYGFNISHDSEVADALAFTTYANGVKGSDALVIMRASGNVGIGTTNPGVELDVAGDIHYTGVLVDTSDRRMKADIRPLSGQLARVAALEGVSFVMKDDPGKNTELGLIAQDVEAVYPDLVKTGAGGIKSLNYIGLTAPLIEAVKELKGENDQLRQDNEAIRAQTWPKHV